MFLKKLKLEVSAWTLVLVCLLIGAAATAGTIKVWGTSDTLTASDLNGNFSHIHNLMVGGHGARLVDADVNASAAIAHSKLATPALLPKVWVMTADPCGSSPCTIVLAVGGVTSVTRASAGNYTVTLTTPRANATYTALVSPQNGGATHASCNFVSVSTSQFQVVCYSDTGTGLDTGFTAAVLDDDN